METYIRIRATQEEKDRWVALAKKEGITLSELVRRRLNERVIEPEGELLTPLPLHEQSGHTHTTKYGRVRIVF